MNSGARKPSARWRTSLFGVVLMTSCGGEATAPSGGDISSIALTPTETSIGVGGNAVIEAVVRDADGDTLSPASVRWSSSDVTVAKVSSSGVVTAVALGAARIAATVQGRSATAVVTVVPTGVAAVELSPTDLRLTEGATRTLVARVVDARGVALLDRAVQWRSSDVSVATVSSSGVVTALGAGTTSIVATSEGKSASISVTVSAVPVASVTITPATASLQVGANRQLAAEVRDASGTIVAGRAVTWSTTTPAIVSVSSSGLVIGVAAGTGTVIASTGGKSATATITVEALPSPIVVGRVTLSPATDTVKSSGTADRTRQLTAQAYRQQGTGWVLIPDATFTFTSSNTAIATVSSSGVVTGQAPGRVTIVATSGSQFATAEIVVESPTAPVVIGRVTVTPTTADIKYTGPTNRTVQLLPSAYTLVGGQWQLVPNAVFTWVSSNPAVATVSPTGLVTGIADGTVNVTVTGGTQSATAQITVSKR